MMQNKSDSNQSIILKSKGRYIMKKLTLAIFAVILINYSVSGAKVGLTLQEVRTASKNILVAYFTSDTLNLNEVDISDKNSWKINGQPCADLFLYSTKANACDHYVYLQ